jgi:hypothetical protein
MTKPEFTFDEESAISYFRTIQKNGVRGLSRFLRGARYQHSIDKVKHEEIVKDLKIKNELLKGYVHTNGYTFVDVDRMLTEIATLKEEIKHLRTVILNPPAVNIIDENSKLIEVNRELMSAIDFDCEYYAAKQHKCIDLLRYQEEVLARVKEILK